MILFQFSALLRNYLAWVDKYRTGSSSYRVEVEIPLRLDEPKAR